MVGCRLGEIDKGWGIIHYRQNLPSHQDNYVTGPGGNSMVDGICLHPVYMSINAKTGLKASARKPAWILEILAPRPGLEPGTCGLTEIQARQKPNKINDL